MGNSYNWNYNEGSPYSLLLLLKFDIPIWPVLLINSVEVRAQCFHLYFLYFFPKPLCDIHIPLHRDGLYKLVVIQGIS